MGFTIFIVRRRDVILCKRPGKSGGFPGPKGGVRGTRASSRRENCTRGPMVEMGGNPHFVRIKRRMGHPLLLLMEPAPPAGL
jgi:hypothetical protein